MNMMPSGLLDAQPVIVDAVRQMPRKVMGLAAVIETDLHIEDLRASLEGIAEDSAFTLTEIREREETTKDGGRCLIAEFRLTAARGCVGDGQIASLLRAISLRHRWNSMEKRLER